MHRFNVGEVGFVKACCFQLWRVAKRGGAFVGRVGLLGCDVRDAAVGLKGLVAAPGHPNKKTEASIK